MKKSLPVVPVDMQCEPVALKTLARHESFMLASDKVWDDPTIFLRLDRRHDTPSFLSVIELGKPGEQVRNMDPETQVLRVRILQVCFEPISLLPPEAGKLVG